MQRTSAQKALTRQILVVSLAALLLVGGVGGWAATASLSAAVMGEGTVIFDDNVKKVQHRDGGIVEKLYVKEGQHVQAGDLLLSLDGTSVRANLEIVESSLAQLYVRRNRLTAERLGQPDFDITVLQDKKIDTVDRSVLIESERTLFRNRAETLVGQRKQLEERKNQLRDEIEGTTVQLNAIEEATTLVKQELDAAQQLFDDKLVTLQRVNQVKRQKADLDGQRGERLAARAQAEGRVNEIDLQILQLDENRREENSKELADVETRIAELEQRRIAIRDQLNRLNVSAMISGRIFQLAIHTVGGVIVPGDTLMLIAPEERVLTVEAKIAARDIDQISRGQTVDIRFSAFDQKVTPEVVGHIVSIAPDIVHEERTGISYYPVRVTPDPDSMAKLKNLDLYPGMPAEVFIRVRDRTVLSYLTKPLADQMNRSFRED